MNPPRSPKPPPRTLAAAPAPSLRAPRAARYEARFPSLVAVIAGGALVPACHAPECGDARADELTAHGPASLRALRRGETSAALHEIGVALGVAAHGRTQPAVGGAMPIASPAPPMPVAQPPAAPVDPPILTMGEPATVGPAPVVAPPVVASPDIAPPVVAPRTTPRRPPSTTPNRSQIRGGLPSVHPQPTDTARTAGMFKSAGPLPDALKPLTEDPDHG
jgi:hypothetical protein